MSKIPALYVVICALPDLDYAENAELVYAAAAEIAIPDGDELISGVESWRYHLHYYDQFAARRALVAVRQLGIPYRCAPYTQTVTHPRGRPVRRRQRAGDVLRIMCIAMTVAVGWTIDGSMPGWTATPDPGYTPLPTVTRSQTYPVPGWAATPDPGYTPLPTVTRSQTYPVPGWPAIVPTAAPDCPAPSPAPPSARRRLVMPGPGAPRTGGAS